MHLQLRHLTFFGLLFAAVGLTGCSTAWNSAQREKLAHVAIAPTIGSPDAYTKPSAKDSPGMARMIPQATGGGLIPSLLGSAIDGAVTAHQQSKFEDKAAVYFEPLKKAFGDVPTAEIDAALLETLKMQPFFAPRLAKDAPAKFSVKIISYGLNKSPLTKGDDILLRVYIAAHVTLTAGDEELFAATYVGVASRAARAGEISQQPDFFTAGRHEAAMDFSIQLMAGLEPKLGKK